MVKSLQPIDQMVPGANLPAYVQAVGSIPVLSVERERELADDLYYNENLQAARELVMSHLRFVVHIARSYSGYGLPEADLIQEGNVGLLEVIKKYDYRKGYRFSTYAAFWIRQSIQLALRRNGSIITLPIRKARLVGRIGETISTFVKENGREPTEEELARLMNIKEELVLL